jgi:hypothetical protein
MPPEEVRHLMTTPPEEVRQLTTTCQAVAVAAGARYSAAPVERAERREKTKKRMKMSRVTNAMLRMTNTLSSYNRKVVAKFGNKIGTEVEHDRRQQYL